MPSKVPDPKAGASGYVRDDLDSVPPLATLPCNMAGVGKLLKQAQKMQRGIAEAQQQLSAERLEVSHGGGAIRVTVDGHGLVHGLAIDPEFLKEEKTVVNRPSCSPCRKLRPRPAPCTRPRCRRPRPVSPSPGCDRP